MISIMDEHSQFLRTLIMNAKSGNGDAEQVLRNVCRSAANHAPTKELIMMAEQLYEFHTEALRQHHRRN